MKSKDIQCTCKDTTERGRERERELYRATIVPVQVGSRGIVEVESFERLQPYLSMSHNKGWRSFLTDIARKVLEESQNIWAERNWADHSTT